MKAPAESFAAMARHRAWQERGRASFTLVEMMLAAVVAVVLVVALATMAVAFFGSTGRVKSVSRTGQDARFALEVMGREIEGIYRERDGSTNEWFDYTNLPNVGPASGSTPNAGQMLFFTTADDRGSTNGDLCAMRYAIAYQALGSSPASSFVMDRSRIDPGPTLTNVWGLDNLPTYWTAHPPGDPDFFAENVAEMWINLGFNQPKGSPATNELVVIQAPTGARFWGIGPGVWQGSANDTLQIGAQPVFIEIYLRVLDDVGAQGLAAGRSLKSLTNAHSQIVSRKVFLPAQ